MPRANLRTRSRKRLSPTTSDDEPSPSAAADDEVAAAAAARRSSGISLSHSASDDTASGEERKSDDGGEDPYPGHPYVGKRVRIVQGPSKGTTAKIVRIKSRGWWTLDNPGLDNVNVHSRRCQLIDTVDEEDLIEYYERRGMKWRGTPPTLRNKKRADAEQHFSDPRMMHPYGTDVGDIMMEEGLSSGGIAFRTLSALGRSGSEMKAAIESAAHHSGASNETSDAEQDTKMAAQSPTKKTRTESDPSVQTVREPVRLSDVLEKMSDAELALQQSSQLGQSSRDVPKHYGTDIVMDSTNIGWIRMPKSIRQLPLDTELTIFDRRIGKVLDKKVPFGELGDVLRNHAEYEPIFPSETPHTLGRSGRGVLVAGSVQPQRATDQPSFKGRQVRVKVGPHTGKMGEIHDRLPGGWFVVGGILNQMPLMLSPKHVEILPVITEEGTK